MGLASGEWAWMAEVAGEELAKLEAAQPGRFGPLKAELKRLIAEPGWDAAAFPLVSLGGGVATATCSASSSAPARFVCTQESSNRKRKWGGGGVVEQGEGNRRKRKASGGKDRAEMAIERAERCLTRIRVIKQSLLGFTPSRIEKEKRRERKKRRHNDIVVGKLK